MHKYLVDCQFNYIALTGLWQSVKGKQNGIQAQDVVELVRNCYLMHCFSLKGPEIEFMAKHTPEETAADPALQSQALNDSFTVNCQQCNQPTTYSSLMLVEDRYKDICLSSQCLEKEIELYLQIGEPLQLESDTESVKNVYDEAD